MRVRWTKPAANDLTSICDYIKEHGGPETARTVALRIYEGVGQLAKFPKLGREGRKSGTREMVFRAFRSSQFTVCARTLLRSIAYCMALSATPKASKTNLSSP